MALAQTLAFPQPHATSALAPQSHGDAPRIASLRAERKLITVMFVDVKSSMDLSSDHAGRACQAALFLRDAIRVPAARLFGTHALKLSIRIGINSGEVLVAALVAGGLHLLTWGPLT